MLEKRDLHLPITIFLMQAIPLKLIGTECADFKASRGWGFRSMQRHSLVLRVCTIYGPTATCHARGVNSSLSLADQGIGVEINKFEVFINMDKTPLFFDVVPGKGHRQEGQAKCGGKYHWKPELAFDCCPYNSCRWSSIASPYHLQGKATAKVT